MDAKTRIQNVFDNVQSDDSDGMVLDELLPILLEVNQKLYNFIMKVDSEELSDKAAVWLIADTYDVA
jgi:hypothetical protein